MNVDQFKRAAFAISDSDEGFALVELAKNGTPQLHEWLQTDGYIWMMNNSHCSSRMQPAAFMVRHKNFANVDEKRDKLLLRLVINHNSLICLNIAEKRGLDVRLWSTLLLVYSLACADTLAWINERVDVTAKLLASSWDKQWRGWYEGRYKIFYNLCETGNNRLLTKILMKSRGDINLSELKKLASMGRDKCLADNGALIHVVLKRRKHMRAKKIKTLRRCGFSQSDLVSIGIQIN